MSPKWGRWSWGEPGGPGLPACRSQGWKGYLAHILFWEPGRALTAMWEGK